MRTSSMALAASAMVGISWGATAMAEGAFNAVDFPTAGGIEARADLYEPKSRSETLILLFHQAGWSRGEYREIAPKLVEAGYRVMAVDQRSGGAVNGVANETAQRAAQKGQPRDYLHAYADLEAALVHAHNKLKAKRVIVWGSSYSASLVLRLAAEHSQEVTAVIAFSPGEYFEKDKGPRYVESLARRVTQPVLVTSSRDERKQAKPIFDAAATKRKILFTPATKGRHGSRALWSESPDHEVYWAAVNEFLKEHAPARPSH